MTHALTRTHVIAPKELIEKVDKLVGPRRRGEFISEAVAEKVERENRIRAVRSAMTLPRRMSLVGRLQKLSQSGFVTFGRTQTQKTRPTTYEVPS